MKTVQQWLSDKAARAMTAAFGAEAESADASIVQATDRKFGHYQLNAAMGLAKRLKSNPREVASRIVEKLEATEACETPEIAGPGFINLRLRPAFITARVRALLGDERLGVEAADPPSRVLVDFSSPNIAKDLHVGHLRSTIIGDSLARVFEFLGHDVLRRNHVGDWGTQFGMLIEHLKSECPQALTEQSTFDLGDIVEFYKAAAKRYKEDPAFAEQARLEVVALQAGDPESLRAWKVLCDQSRRQFEEIYSTLKITIEEKGESYYNPMIPSTLEELDEKGLIEISDGAKCIFVEGFKNKEGDPMPLIVQKRDGGYNYDTTDMAAIRYRTRTERADKILYVTDAGQATHFNMIFGAARRAGWLGGVEAAHVPFGMVLGDDRKKFKTRSGDTVRLQDLLDEAVVRARTVVDEKNPELSESTRAEIANRVSVAAIKYADLSQNRISDYVFSFDKMLALNGNTAPYLLYAYARIQSIARKGGIDFAKLDPQRIEPLETPDEIDLGYLLIRFPEVLLAVERELAPNRLTDYVYELSQTFSRFYTNDRVLGDPRETTRLALCEITARTLRQGLRLLGIEVVEEM